MDCGVDRWEEREQLELQSGLRGHRIELSDNERLGDVRKAGDEVGDPQPAHPPRRFKRTST